VDIVSRTGDVLLGPEWPRPQAEGDCLFRRLTGDAFVYAPAIEPIEHRVIVEAAAEPGLEQQIVLSVFGQAGRLLGEAVLGARESLVLHLPAGPPVLHAMRFNVRAVSRPNGVARPTPWARIFAIRAQPLRPDVVPQRAGFSVGGGGWYSVEQPGREPFRWVNNDAEIVVTDLAARRLELDVAPGPALGGKPLGLTVLEHGEQRERFVIPERRRITVDLPARETPLTLTLHADHSGEPLAGSERVLNFRLFHIPPA
jgi:hypothetical protein